MPYGFFLSALALLVSFGFLLISIAARRIVGTWINPTSILSGFWFFYSTVPLIFGWGVPVNPFALLFIVTFVLFFGLSTFLFSWKKALAINENKLPAIKVFNNNYIFLTLVCMSIASVFCFSLDLITQGLESHDLVGISGEYANLRYSLQLERNIYSQIATVLSFPSVALAGLVMSSTKNWKKRIVSILAGFSPSVFLILIQGAKGSFFLSASLFLGAYLIVKIYNNDLAIFTRKFVAGSVVAVFVGLSLATISFVLRGGLMEADADTIFWNVRYSLLSYSSGHIFAFSSWFTDRYFDGHSFRFVQEELTLGFYTFMSLFKLGGDDRFVPLGIYEEVFSYRDMLTTNIYSIFRGLITDFSLFGALVFAFGWGLISNWLFSKLLSKKFSAFSISVFIFNIGIFYQSYLISSLTWLSIPISFFVFYLLLSAPKIRIK